MRHERSMNVMVWVALGLLLFHALTKPRLVPVALCGAFVATVLANTVRLVG